MVFPSVIGIEPNGNGLNGIIYSLKNNYGITNPIESGIIELTSTQSYSGSIENTIVGWEKVCWVTYLNYSNPYYQVYFPKGRIEISGYSLRGCGEGWFYPKKWKVFGFNDDDKNDESKWDELGENFSTSSQPYCYTTNTNCITNYEVTTFTTKKMNKLYRYIRFVSTESSCSTDFSRFILSGFDIFGVLYFDDLKYFNRYYNGCTCIKPQRALSRDIVNLF